MAPRMRIHLVSFSFPPDNTPAAHRPYQLARFLARHEVAFEVHTRHGAFSSLDSFPKAVIGSAPTKAKGKAGAWILGMTGALAGRLLQVDKGLPWALRTLPKLIGALRADRRAGSRPVLWATAPLASNIALAWVASVLTRSDLHVDLRDALDGINSRPMPLLTRLALTRAKSVTVVTPTMASLVKRRALIDAPVIYNGISTETMEAMAKGRVGGGRWVDVAYAGAVYGGDRPYVAAIELLRSAAELLPAEMAGIRLRIASREQLDDLKRQDTDRFKIDHCGELSKADALALTANSHANLLLVGSGEVHRCGIPLKTYDMLGVGRPILYFGPTEADAGIFLRTYASDRHLSIDSERQGHDRQALVEWLLRAMQAESLPASEPSADSQSEAIARLLEVA